MGRRRKESPRLEPALPNLKSIEVNQKLNLPSFKASIKGKYFKQYSSNKKANKTIEEVNHNPFVTDRKDLSKKMNSQTNAKLEKS